MWTEITRPQYERSDLRYASDLGDAEWKLIAPICRHPRPWDGLERPPCVTSSTPFCIDCAALAPAFVGAGSWRLLPKDFPPPSTVQRYFAYWRDSGLWARINRHLLMAARRAEGRGAKPSVGIIDSQSVKTTESGGPRGFDAGMKVKGRKRHIFTDTGGLLVTVQVHGANVQDRDGAPAVVACVRHTFPTLRHVFADIAYTGAKRAAALKPLGRWRLEIVKRFEVLLRRWVVERTLAWLSRSRRLAKV